MWDVLLGILIRQTFDPRRGGSPSRPPAYRTRPPSIPCLCSVRKLALIVTYGQHGTVVRLALTHGV